MSLDGLTRTVSNPTAELLWAACRPEPGTPVVSKEPTSVRGWIADVERPESGMFKTVETEAARRAQLFQSTNIWMDDAPYVSGGRTNAGWPNNVVGWRAAQS